MGIEGSGGIHMWRAEAEEAFQSKVPPRPQVSLPRLGTSLVPSFPLSSSLFEKVYSFCSCPLDDPGKGATGNF